MIAVNAEWMCKSRLDPGGKFASRCGSGGRLLNRKLDVGIYPNFQQLRVLRDHGTGVLYDATYPSKYRVGERSIHVLAVRGRLYPTWSFCVWLPINPDVGARQGEATIESKDSADFHLREPKTRRRSGSNQFSDIRSVSLGVTFCTSVLGIRTNFNSKPI